MNEDFLPHYLKNVRMLQFFFSLTPHVQLVCSLACLCLHFYSIDKYETIDCKLLVDVFISEGSISVIKFDTFSTINYEKLSGTVSVLYHLV